MPQMAQDHHGYLLQNVYIMYNKYNESDPTDKTTPRPVPASLATDSDPAVIIGARRKGDNYKNKNKQRKQK